MYEDEVDARLRGLMEDVEAKRTLNDASRMAGTMGIGKARATSVEAPTEPSMEKSQGRATIWSDMIVVDG